MSRRGSAMTDHASLAPPPTGDSAVRAAARNLRTHLGDPLHRTGYLLLLGAAIGALLGLVFWGVAARVYSPQVVGINSATISAMMLVSGACQLGLNAVLVRYLPTAGPSARTLVLRSYVVTVAISLAIGALAAATSSTWSPELSFLGSDARWFVTFTLATAMWTVFSLQDSVMIGLMASAWVPVENLVYSLAKVVLLVAVIAVLPLAGPFVAWNLPVAVAIVAITWFIFRRLLPRHRERDPGGFVDRATIIATARGNYGGTLFSLASTMLLPIMVAGIAGVRETAYFFLPWTISTGLLLIALNMTTSLTVEAALHEQRLRDLTRRAFSLTLRIVGPLAVLTFAGAPLLLAIFGPDYADEGSRLLRLLAIASLPNVLVALALAVSRIQHRGRMVLAIQAAQCILVLGLSLLLLPAHGIEGVGVAWLVSQLAVAAAVLAGQLRPLLLGGRAQAA